VSLLSIEEAADRLGTSPRFIRRLIAERRIAFTKLGRHVRLDSSDIDAFVAAGRVEPREHWRLRGHELGSRPV
jgi:excisionase family DNA binding protein